MTGLLEVTTLHAADAERAEAGGADRLTLTDRLGPDALSPDPSLVGQVRRATSLPLRVLVRLREGFSTDGGEVGRLQGLVRRYRDSGADGIVLGFLNGHTEIDVAVIAEVLGEATGEPGAQDAATQNCAAGDAAAGGGAAGGGGFGWTFDRAVDSCISTDRAWRELRRLPGLDQVLTAGSARGVSEGLDELVARARADDFARSVIMAGGDLLPEHVPWLARAGVRAFHIDGAARPLGSAKAYVDPDLVRTWRTLIDDAVNRSER